MTVPATTKSNCGSMESEEKGEQLLPRLPNKITIDLITPKLSWKDFPILLSISGAWQRAAQSHRIYRARVRSRTTVKFVLVSHIYSHSRLEQRHGIVLYTVGQKTCYELPPISALQVGLPYSCQCVSGDGSVYVLGGAKGLTNNLGCAEVYKLDLAGGKRQWKQCASMQEPRVNFGCGVLDGKIYVFGGESIYKPVSGSEVYDPEIDAWFPVKPIPLMRVHHQVLTVGAEFVVHGGGFYEEDKRESCTRPAFKEALFVDIYNPAKDEWRRIERFKGSIGGVFVAQGKLHLVSPSGIHVYDFDDNSWTLVHSCSFLHIGSVEYVGSRTLAAVLVDDELYWRVCWEVGGSLGLIGGSSLFQSVGFGGENRIMIWEKAPSLSFTRRCYSLPHGFLSPIEV